MGILLAKRLLPAGDLVSEPGDPIRADMGPAREAAGFDQIVKCCPSKREEIEDLGKSERRGISSHLATLVEHLLKLKYARGLFREYNARGWRVSIRSARRQVRKLLNESPSLRPQLEEMLVDAYEDGRLEALRERRLKEDTLPKTSPWTLEQLMDDSFMPD